VEERELLKHFSRPLQDMKLLTKALRKKLPPLYTTEQEADPLIVCKFFSPYTNWEWYAMEFDGTDTFFGWVRGYEDELGYFSLSELEQNSPPEGTGIERDLSFTPIRQSALKRVMAAEPRY
jgi:hypothetical protein